VKRLLATAFLLVLALAPVSAYAADTPQPGLELKQNDRIVLVGDTLIERDQRYGYLETLLTVLHPTKNLTFRNLGWSGDTVLGLSRAGFDPPAAGFKQLVTEVHAAHPTVLLFGYGMAESFDGPDGMPRFLKGYNTLLDALADTKARVVLLSPIAHAKMSGTSPDPTRHNADLERYTEAIQSLAQSRGHLFIDLFNPTRSQYPLANLSDNGIHLNEAGYRFLATQIVRAISPPGALGTMEIAVNISKLQPDSSVNVKFNVDSARLALTLEPTEREPLHAETILKVTGLPAGTYQLNVDGQPITAKPAEAWAHGVNIASAADRNRLRQVHRAINRKNQLFFDRWRPQNITYLFGFRKHEQGQNAIEIPQFDPLVADLESAIAKLAKPSPHAYELTLMEAEVAQ
jgi:lysophospholipase L1-like esterase